MFNLPLGTNNHPVAVYHQIIALFLRNEELTGREGSKESVKINPVDIVPEVRSQNLEFVVDVALKIPKRTRVDQVTEENSVLKS